MVTPMDCTNSAAILVPMRLSVYCNYGSNRVQQTDPNSQAYLAAIPSIKGDTLSTESDIFESMRDAPFMASADPTRKAPAREGIYLHWELPSYYRTGTAQSSSVQNQYTNQQQNMAPSFPAVPDTYVVVRTVTSASQTQAGLWGKQDDLDSSCVPGQATDPNLPNQTVDVFIVDSALVRSTEDLGTNGTSNGYSTRFFEDAEVTCSPFIDTSDDSKPTPAFLGRTTRAENWVAPSDDSMVYLTAHRNGSPFFADFQPHNSSVFSIFDPLDSITDPTLVLRQGVVNYTVVGFYRNRGDPMQQLWMNQQSLLDGLAGFGWVLNSNMIDTTSLPTPQSLGTFCHGSLSGIEWSTLSASPSSMKNPADNFQANASLNQPFTVGSNAIDALYGWIDGIGSTDSAVQDVKPQLRKLQTWVLDINDNLDSQLQAQDLLSTNNFVPTISGNVWHVEVSQTSATGAPVVPSLSVGDALQSSNYQAQQYNSLLREMKYRGQQLFDAWWAFKCDPSAATALQLTVDFVNQRMQALQTFQVPSNNSQPNLGFPTRSVPDNHFFQQREPTLLIAGMGSKWQGSKAEMNQVRIDGQDTLISWLNSSDPGSNWLWDRGEYPQNYPLQAYYTVFSKAGLVFNVDALMRLLAEGVCTAGSANSSSPVAPAYFGISDRWDGWNGWHPLFVEWEVEYYDIPFTDWIFKPCGPESRWGYTIADTVDLSSLQSQVRKLSGRSAVLPQTGKMLSNVLQQVFGRIDPDTLKSMLGSTDPDSLLADVSQLDYLSTNLSGFMDQLCLRVQGAHLTPLTNENAPGFILQYPIDSEATSGAAIHLDSSGILAMVGACETTKMTQLDPSESNYTLVAAPLTHGQFRFTRLNIVDRWGQVVHGVRQDSTMTLTEYAYSAPRTQYTFPTAVFPALGEEYSVAPLPNAPTVARTVMPRADSGNSFVQLPPSLNHPARVNFDFLQVGTNGSWRPNQSYENPVIAYIVYNTANESLQIFTDEGLFMCEFLISEGTIASRPFPANQLLYAANKNPLLQSFVNALQTSPYASALYQNIQGTVSNVQSEPGNAAETMQAILGRPLALVAFSASIELAQVPVPGQFSSIERMDEQLAVKFGDHDNVFDGLYCLFNSDPSSQVIDFNTIYSYTDAQNPIQPINFQPFWIDPIAENYTDIIGQAYSVFGALVDPFTAVHAYTALLPIKQLELPKWAISRGLSQIASFFHAGPIVVAGDIPGPDPITVLQPGSLTVASDLPTTIASIAMPSLGYADWAWLQPSLDSTGKATQYNIVDIAPQPSGPQFVEGPHTATEGYLLMRKPFGPPDTLKPSS